MQYRICIFKYKRRKKKGKKIEWMIAMLPSTRIPFEVVCKKVNAPDDLEVYAILDV